MKRIEFTPFDQCDYDAFAGVEGNAYLAGDATIAGHGALVIVCKDRIDIMSDDADDEDLGTWSLESVGIPEEQLITIAQGLLNAFEQATLPWAELLPRFGFKAIN